VGHRTRKDAMRRCQRNGTRTVARQICCSSTGDLRRKRIGESQDVVQRRCMRCHGVRRGYGHASRGRGFPACMCLPSLARVYFLECGIIRAPHREQSDSFFPQAHQNGRQHVWPSSTRTAAAGQADRVDDAPANVAPKPSLPRPFCHTRPRWWSHVARRIGRVFKRTPVITTEAQRT
jgi:hypothetical protein